MSTFNFSSTADDAASHFTASIAGKHMLITGATIGGLGGETARAIAHHNPALIVLAGRSLTKLEASKAAILGACPSANIRLLVADFGSLASVRAAAKEVNEYSEPIDILINNIAAIVPFSKTPDNLDLLFETNYLSPFLFTNLIKPRLLASPSPRVVNVSSAAHHAADLDLDTFGKLDETTYEKWNAYSKTKTATILFNDELARRWKGDGITAIALHPGTIKTNYVTEDTAKELISFGLGHMVGEDGSLGTTEHWKSVAQGAATHVVAAFDPSLKNHSGSYLVDGNLADDQVAAYAKDPVKAAGLWALSEKLVGQTF